MSAQDGFGAASLADVCRVVTHFCPFEAANGAQFHGLVFALGADFVRRHRQILRIFARRNFGAAAGAANYRRFNGKAGAGGEFFVQEFEHAFGEMFGGQTEMLDEFPGITGNTEAISDTGHRKLQRKVKILALLENGAGNDIAESTDLMFFRSNYDASFFGRPH